MVFLIGAGQEPADWDDQVGRLDDCSSLVLTIDDLAGPSFGFELAVEGLHARILETGADSVMLVGLSVGGMIATRYAATYPDQLVGLLLSGSQVKPNPVMLGIQRMIMRLLPARRLPLPEGLSKPQFMQMLDVVAQVDLREDLPRITAPSLVLCGSKDPFNLPAAKAIAAVLPEAELRVISGGGHELNTDKPEDFAQAVQDLLSHSD